MSERMIGIRASITRCLDDSSYPSFVECQLVDAHGNCHRFHEKDVIVTLDSIDSTTIVPHPAVIACRIVSGPSMLANEKVYLVDTELPWHVSSLADLTRFEIRASELVEWTLGQVDERPWNEVGRS